METSITKVAENSLIQINLLRKSSGLNHLKFTNYTQEQEKLIKWELARLFLARQEIVNNEVIREWINTFQELRYSFNTIIQRIKIAKISKRYGNQTTIADFTDINTSLYTQIYSEELGMIKLICSKCGELPNRVREYLGFNFDEVIEHKQNNCGGLISYERE